MSNHLQLDGLDSIPFATLFLIGVNISIHAILFLSTFNPGYLAISANHVIFEGQLYRLISSAFVHGGLLHIFMNMSSLMSLGISLEQQFGSLSFFLVSIWGAIIGNLIYISISALIWFLTGNFSYMQVAAVGYSGVLFSYAAIESYHTNVPTRSVFGCFNVPSRVYPWILLILIQVILPNISLLGHLSGMLYGIFLIIGGDSFILPSPQYLEYLEQSSYFNHLYRKSNYIRCTGKSYSVRENILGDTTSSSALVAIGNGILYILGLFSNVIDTLLYICNLPPSYQIWTRFIRFMSAMNPFASTFGTVWNSDEHEHSSDTENEVSSILGSSNNNNMNTNPSILMRAQRVFTSARDPDGLGSYSPLPTVLPEEANMEEGKDVTPKSNNKAPFIV